MRNLFSLIAAAALVACSDAPVQPKSHATGGRLAASANVATGGTDTSASLIAASDTAASDSVIATDTAGSTDTATTAPAPTTTDSTTTDSTTASTASVSSLEPLYCPSLSEVRSVRGVIGPDGGVIGVRGHELKLPAGAVTEPTEFEIVVPVSSYMQIEVHAVGRDSYLFQLPASITISFQRCTSLPASPLTAAHVDRSNRIVENMGGAVDKTNKRVTFPTGHLSGYIVAY